MLLSFLAVLYAGALLLSTTGLMGMSGLCSFNWALMGGLVGVFLCPVSDLSFLEDEVALLQGFGNEVLVLFCGVVWARVDVVMYFLERLLWFACKRSTHKT